MTLTVCDGVKKSLSISVATHTSWSTFNSLNYEGDNGSHPPKPVRLRVVDPVSIECTHQIGATNVICTLENMSENLLSRLSLQLSSSDWESPLTSLIRELTS